MSDKKSKFGLGVAVGVAAGVAAGMLLTPKTGKQNRKIVAKKLKELQKRVEQLPIEKDLEKLYENVKIIVLKKLDEVQKRVGELGYDKYEKIVLDAVSEAKKKFSNEASKLEKLKERLLTEWESEL